MAEWTLHGQRRQSRRYATYKHCPLPTPEDRRMAFQRFGGAKTSGRPVSGKLGGGKFLWHKEFVLNLCCRSKTRQKNICFPWILSLGSSPLNRGEVHL